MKEFDVIVVGTGASGTSAAELCAAAGRRVAIVDERPYGGTCALRGCDPKKVLVGAAEVADWARRMRGSGIRGSIEIVWPELMRFKHSFTDPFPEQLEEKLRAGGVTTYHGPARFTGAQSLDAAGEAIAGSHIVIATGARPAPLRLQGEELLITSTEFLDLELLPKRIAFVGGGYIAFEFAHLATRAGASAVILQRGPRVLAGFEPSLVDAVVEVSRRIGIEVRTGMSVTSIEAVESGTLIYASSEGAEFTLDCDVAIHAAGRVADLDELALEAGGIARTARGVTVNEFLQSRTNPAVYAAGDSADGGGIRLRRRPLPKVSWPRRTSSKGIATRSTSLASRASSTRFRRSVWRVSRKRKHANGAYPLPCAKARAPNWYSSRRVRAEASRYRLLVEEATGEIVGAHVLGPHTEELINIFSLAIRAKIGAATFSNKRCSLIRPLHQTSLRCSRKQ